MIFSGKILLKRIALGGTSLTLLAGLGGCFDEEHYTRRDFVTGGAGNAVAANQAIQTIDPWPREAKNTNINIDGKRLNTAVARYQQNKSIPPKGLNTTTVTEQAGPGNQQSTDIQK